MMAVFLLMQFLHHCLTDPEGGTPGPPHPFLSGHLPGLEPPRTFQRQRSVDSDSQVQMPLWLQVGGAENVAPFFYQNISGTSR